MDITTFVNPEMGALIDISGTDSSGVDWNHKAFVPAALPDQSPNLSQRTYRAVADARAAVAALDSTARQLPNPTLLRRPTLQREAQSTSALEGTYAPLSDVLTADEQNPGTVNLREIMNYVQMADYAYQAVMEGRPLSVGFLCDLQAMLVQKTPHEGRESGQLRSIQVVIGQQAGARANVAPVYSSRFVPSPPGDDLRARLSDLLDWMSIDHSGTLDPVVASGMGHYQFETLHPFHDGNGRIGRLLMSIQLLRAEVIKEPALTVSPWFEERRTEYYDRLFAVSAESDWDSWLSFYATGLEESAIETRSQILRLVETRKQMHDVIRSSALRAGTAYTLADYAVAHPSFTVRSVERDLGVSYGRANRLVEQLTELGLLAELPSRSPSRRFHSPEVLRVLVS